jgi:hypothetical protein
MKGRIVFILSAGILATSCGTSETPNTTNNNPYNNVSNSAQMWCASTSGFQRTCALSQGRITTATLQTNFVGNCIQGTDWDFNYNSVSVTNNCDAIFNLVGTDMVVPPQYLPSARPGTSPNLITATASLTCSSMNLARTHPPECTVNHVPAVQNIRIVLVRLVHQISEASCLTEGAYGFYEGTNAMWADHGCRGLFSITYTHT